MASADENILAVELDEEIVQEALADLDEHHEQVEILLSNLRTRPQDLDLLNALFREVHTVKGSAAVFQISHLVGFVQAVESVVAALREWRVVCSEPVSEALLLAMDRVRDLHLRALRDGDLSPPEDQESIRSAVLRLAESSAEAADEHARQAIARMRGELPEVLPVPELLEEARPPQLSDQARQDLGYFRELAQQVDAQTPFWQGRSQILLRLALRMNQLAGAPLDPAVLTAAVYLHDVGMAFLPGAILNKEGKLDDAELALLHRHPVLGWEWLRRLPGWEDAAEAVLHHHEREDGSGYPHGLSGEEIHPGAKILAILDAYYAMTHQRADRTHKRSILRAVTEINACAGRQFAAEWVKVFNTAVRLEAREGLL